MTKVFSWLGLPSRGDMVRHRHATAEVPPHAVATPGPRTPWPPVGDVLWVAAGGAAGALARVGLAETFPTAPGAFPWTTFAENVVGAFLLALVLTWLVEQTRARPQVRLAVCTGALGSFTTYSTLATEATTRLAEGDPLLAGGYAIASVACGLLAALAGARAVRGRSKRHLRGGRP